MSHRRLSEVIGFDEFEGRHCAENGPREKPELRNKSDQPKLSYRLNPLTVGDARILSRLLVNTVAPISSPSEEKALGCVIQKLPLLSSATAVIATDSGGVPDVLEEGRYGLLVPPNDPALSYKGKDSLRDALVNLARARATAKQSDGD